MHKITVITVALNDEHNLQKTIESVLQQTYPHVEYIIVDGGSKDGTIELLKKFNSQIDLWISEKDSGIYDAMNKGIKLAKGDWLHFLNAGDFYCEKTSLEKMMKTISKKNNVNFIYTKNVKSVNIFNQNCKLSYLFRKTINHQSIIYSKTLFQERLYNTKYFIIADFDHLLNTLKKIIPYRVDEINFINYNDRGLSSKLQNINIIWLERADSILRSKTPIYFKFTAVIYSLLAYAYRKLKNGKEN